MVGSSKKQLQQSYYIRLAGALAFIAIFSLLALGLVFKLSLNEAMEHYSAKAEIASDKLRNQLADNVAVVSALSGWFHSQGEVRNSELASFSQDMRLSYPHIHTILFMPMVEADDRPHFEKKMVDRGYAGFRVKDWGSEKAYIPANNRERSFPITFIDPLEPDTAHLLGFNVASGDDLLPAINQAITTAEVVASPVVYLKDGSEVFFLLKAVYRGKITPESESDRNHQVEGVFSLVVNPTDLKALILKEMGNMPSEISLINHSYNGDDRLGRVFHSEEGVRGRAGSILPHVAIEVAMDDVRHPFRLSFNRQLTLLDIEFVFSLGIAFLGVLMMLLARSSLRSDYLHAVDNEEAKDFIYKEKEKAEVTLHSIADGVITTDMDDHIEHINAVACELTGWEPNEALGKYLDDIFLILAEESRDVIHRLMDDQNTHLDVNRHVILKRYDGEEHSIKLSASYIHDRSDSPVGKVIVFSDVTQERKMAQLLSHQASHDDLTGLFNRREFEEKLRESLENSHYAAQHDVLCFIDLDQFKVVNDTCGHMAGDELLKQLTHLLKENIRESDILARIGGDEFALIFNSCPMEKAVDIANHIHNEIRAYRFSWGEKIFDVGASMGLVEITSQVGSLHEVMSAADSACYVAKDKGRNQIFAHTLGDNEILIRQGEMHWVHRINKALEANRFVLYRQKISPLSAGDHPLHYEVLIRMKDEAGDIVPPMAFLPAAERYNLMPELDRWVIDTALASLANQSDDDVIYNINLSGKSVGDERLLGFITDAFERYGVSPQMVCFEITETAAVSNLSVAVKLFEALKRYGCMLALDDFGSGISSFTYLKNLPVDFLKIDGSFVRDMATDPIDREMVASISRIGHVMNLLTVAEFVESDAICNKLIELGVDYAQGFYIAKPEEWVVNTQGIQQVQDVVHDQ